MSDLWTRQSQNMHSLERAIENFKKIGVNNYTPAKIRSRITALKDVWKQFQNGYYALLKVTSETVQTTTEYFKDKFYDRYEDTYQRALDYMSERLEEVEPYVSPNQSMEADPTRAYMSGFSLTHLPPINLPPFDGKCEQWENFRDRFSSLIIHNKELSDFSRMHFLISCLKDKALECIGDIQVTADNFQVAWQALTSRYENKKRLINVHLSSLFNLNAVNRDSANELQLLRDKANIAVASLKNLNRSPSELWNDALVHITQKLDPVIRKAWHLKARETDDPRRHTTSSTNFSRRELAPWKTPNSRAARSPNRLRRTHFRKLAARTH